MLSLLMISLVGVVYCNAASTMSPHTGGGENANQDHLLQVLEAIHKLHSFNQLPPSERIILVELMAAAEVDQITHYIDRIGFTRILTFIDHVTKIDAHEAHRLEEYLWKELDQERPAPVGPAVIGKKRDVQSITKIAQNMMSYTNLTSEEKNLLQEIIQGAENGALTPVVHREGYSRIIKLIEGKFEICASPSCSLYSMVSQSSVCTISIQTKLEKRIQNNIKNAFTSEMATTISDLFNYNN